MSRRSLVPIVGPAQQDEGVLLPSRSYSNFVGAGVTATDDSANDATKVTIPGITVQDEGVARTIRPFMNFSGGGVTATDDAGNNRINITINEFLQAITAGNGKISWGGGAANFTGSNAATATFAHGFGRVPSVAVSQLINNNPLFYSVFCVGILAMDATNVTFAYQCLQNITGWAGVTWVAIG